MLSLTPMPPLLPPLLPPRAIGQWKPCSQSSQRPQGAPPLGNGLTFTSPVLDGCWMGWPSCFSVLGFRPQVLTEGVLSETTRSQTGDLSAFRVALSLSSPCSTPTPAPFPFNSPSSRSVPDLTTQRKGLPGPGQSHAAASAHISWGWKNCSHGSCRSQ